MSLEFDQPDHIFPLLLTSRHRIIYESHRRTIYDNLKVAATLSPKLDQIFSELLKKPHTPVLYSEFYSIYFPNDGSARIFNYEIKEILFPDLSQLRKVLREVNPKIKDLIETVREAGLMYIPDPSVLDWQYNPPLTSSQS